MSRFRDRAWLLCLPAALVLVLVAGWPLVRTMLFAFTDATLSDLAHFEWVGLLNFQDLWLDPDWWRSVSNTFLFVALSVTIETALGLAFALLLHTRLQGRGFLRAAVLAPWAIPTVVSAKMWAWMFNDQFGVINKMLLAIGAIHQPIAWLAEDRLTLLAVVLVDVWKTTPFMTILLLAGLQTIPTSLYEAAALDGASAFRRFRSITLPLLRPALGVAILFRLLDALRIFDLPYVLSSNSRSVAVMSVYARQQLVDFQDVGYGSAASILIFTLIGTVALLFVATGVRPWKARP